MLSSTFSYTSADGTEIAAYRWDPDGPPRAAVQLTHGMGEHARRYEHVARALNDAGFVVYAQDHRGHGASADPDALGDLGKGGWAGLVGDIGLLSTHIRAEHPGLPLILLGHSMGSFAVQQYLFDHSADADAVVLTGTAAIDLLEGALEQVDSRRPGQHHAVGGVAVVEQVLLDGERPHAVAEQDERQAWVLRPDMGREQADVVDQPGPAALTQVAERLGIGALPPGTGAVAPVILGVDHEAGVVQRPGDVLVAPRVLAHAVRELHRGSRLARRVPPVGGDLRAVR